MRLLSNAISCTLSSKNGWEDENPADLVTFAHTTHTHRHTCAHIPSHTHAHRHPHTQHMVEE